MERDRVSLETAKKLEAARFPQETERFWRIRYSTSELGMAHEDYGKPDVSQHSLTRHGWYVGNDARRELKPAVVRWYDAEVAAIDREQVAAPGAQELADVLPARIELRRIDQNGGVWLVREMGSGFSNSGPTIAEALAALFLATAPGEGKA